jgi:hypothetical protein
MMPLIQNDHGAGLDAGQPARSAKNAKHLQASRALFRLPAKIISAVLFTVVALGVSNSYLGQVIPVSAESEPRTSLNKSANGADSQTVEIYEYGGDRSPVAVVLRLPPEFRYGQSVGAQKSLGLNILTFYPSLTSVRDPANAAYGLHCAGFCNGRILISIEYHPSLLTRHLGPSTADALARGAIKYDHRGGSR